MCTSRGYRRPALLGGGGNATRAGRSPPLHASYNPKIAGNCKIWSNGHKPKIEKPFHFEEFHCRGEHVFFSASRRMSQQAAPELAQHFAHLDLNLHTSLKSPELGPILCIPVGSCEAMSVVRTAPCVENHHAQSKHKSGLVRGHAAIVPERTSLLSRAYTHQQRPQHAKTA